VASAPKGVGATGVSGVLVQNLTGFSHGFGSPIGSVQDNQLWGTDWGVLR
jgi:hypothetical protein